MMSPGTTKQGGLAVALSRTKKKRGVKNEYLQIVMCSAVCQAVIV